MWANDEEKGCWSLVVRMIIPFIPEGYNYRSDLLADLIAGFSVAAMIIPQSISLIRLIELPVIYGLHTSLVSALSYSWLGRSFHISPGPFVASVFILKPVVQDTLGVTDSSLLASHPLYIPMIMMSTFISGIFILLLGVSGIGNALGRILQPSFITGFTTASALVTISSQLLDIFFNQPERIPKLSQANSGIFGTMAEPLQNITRCLVNLHRLGHVPTIAFSLITLMLLLILKFHGQIYGIVRRRELKRRVSPLNQSTISKTVSIEPESAVVIELEEIGKEKQEEEEPPSNDQNNDQISKSNSFPIPDILITVVISSITCYLIHSHFSDSKLRMLGKIEKGFPQWDHTFLNVLDWNLIAPLILPSFIISILSLVLTMSLEISFASSTEGKAHPPSLLYPVDPMRESISLGLSNILCSLLQGYHASAYYSRGAVLKASGAKSHFSTWIAGIVTAAVMLWLTFLFHYVPMSSLAVIVCFALFGSFKPLLKLGSMWNGTEFTRDSAIPSIFGRRFDFSLFVITFLSIILSKMEWGVLLGMFICVLQFVFEYVVLKKNKEKQVE